MGGEQDTAALLPCPFCGGDNIKISGPYGWYKQYCISHSCLSFYSGAQELAQGFHSRDHAITAWNTRAALRSQPAGEWLPIESAPKDGGVIRLFDPTLYDGEFNFYFDGHHTDCGPDDQACWMGPVYSGCHDEWITMRINPTHWQPLPTPPARGEKT